jgi:hypothetical protein
MAERLFLSDERLIDIRGYASQRRRSRKSEEVASGKPEAYRHVLRQSRGFISRITQITSLTPI